MCISVIFLVTLWRTAVFNSATMTMRSRFSCSTWAARRRCRIVTKLLYRMQELKTICVFWEGMALLVARGRGQEGEEPGRKRSCKQNKGQEGERVRGPGRMSCKTE